MRRICFVTPELAPFTPGGIGQLLHHLIVDLLASAPSTQVHLMVPTGWRGDPAKVAAGLGGRVTVHRARPIPLDGLDGRVYPSRDELGQCPHRADALELALSLVALEEEGLSFDAIEFPDYLGWAFAAIQEKRTGRALRNALLVVRLHAPAGLIDAIEQRPPTLEGMALFEMERQALLMADLVVAHLEPVVEAVASFYGFPASWTRGVRVQFPPLGPDPRSLSRWPGDRDLVFATKLQPIKQPALFVRGAVRFLARAPWYRGQAVLSCHQDAAREAELSALIPPELRSRFVFEASGAGRLERLARGVVVVPSVFETLNLVAYEAAAAGGQLVLNAKCPAFGPGTPFRDGVNCITFDGSVEGLAGALERSVQAPPPARLERPAGALGYLAERAQPTTEVSRRPTVCLAIELEPGAANLDHCLRGLASSTWRELEVILWAEQGIAEDLLPALRWASPTVTVVTLQRGASYVEAREAVLQRCRGAVVGLASSDHVLHPRCVELAGAALGGPAPADVFVPHVGVSPTHGDVQSRRYQCIHWLLGSTPSLGLVEDRFSAGVFFARAEVLKTALASCPAVHDDAALGLRMSMQGYRTVVSNEVLVSSFGPERRRAPARPSLGGVGALVPGQQLRFVEARSPAAHPTPFRHQLADRLNAWLGERRFGPMLKAAIKRANR